MLEILKKRDGKIELGPYIFILALYTAAALLYFSRDAARYLWVIATVIADGLALYLIIQFIREGGDSRLSTVANICFLSVLIIASIAVPVYFQAAQDSNLSAFNGKLDTFTSIEPVYKSEGDYSVNPVFANSDKVIVIDISTKSIDRTIHFALPDDLAAKEPNEVSVVVYAERGTVEYGKYDNGARAYIRTCKITIVDVATGFVLAEKTFEGGPAPQTVHSNSDAYGDEPNDAIIAYLTGAL